MAKKKPPAAASEPPCITLHPLELANLDERAPPRVKDILLAIAALSVAEQEHLCRRLHRFMHPDWLIVQKAEWMKDQEGLQRMTADAMKYSKRENRGYADYRKRDATIIKLWNGGAPKGLKAGQILYMIRDKYPEWGKKKNGTPLNRGDVESVIQNHKKKQRTPS